MKASGSVLISCLIILLTGILGVMLFSHSALLSGHTSSMHIDSQVYIYTAQQILKGKILYRDVFDHKGPVMYIFECAGIFLNDKGYAGLWFIQWLVFVSGTAPLFVFWAKKHNLLLVVTALIFMASWVFRTKTIGDNLPEIYAISLVSLFYFLCLKINEPPKNSGLYHILSGMCGMGLFFIKPNFSILVLPAFIWLLYILSKEKKQFIFLKNYLIGCLILVLPFVFYFAFHHALYDAYFAIWKFNFSYISNQKLPLTESIYEVFFKNTNYLLVFILSGSVARLIFYKNEKLLTLLLFSTLALSVIILVGLPGRGAQSVHYAIPLAPLSAWLIIYIGQSMKKSQVLLLFCISIYFSKPLLIHLFSEKKDTEIVNANIQYINLHKTSGEALCVLGNHSAVYWQTSLPCNTAFFYTYPLMQDCNSEINNQFAEQFQQNRADWVLYQGQYSFDTCITNVLKNYTLVSSDKQEKLFHVE